MARFVCQSCGAVKSKWSGRCDTCGEWNTLIEEVAVAATSAKPGHPLEPLPLRSVTGKTASRDRISSGLKDVDDVLGSGFVPGSVTLIAGEPGIGKSTLLLQLASNIATDKKPVLYVSGEESEGQVALRAKRLSLRAAGLSLAVSNSANDIATTIGSKNYTLVVVDSIQTVAAEESTSAPGSVSQVTVSAQIMSAAAKSANTALVLVGHVTKQGSIAGPKTLEHLVDVVLNFEGERYGGLKVLRAGKNRYGSTQETGILEMTERGLREVKNPSAALLAERQVTDGSIVLATVEGLRPLLVEVQALVSPTQFGYPKRAASGFDLNRLSLLAAVITSRTKLDLSNKDIYVNIVGGVRVDDPAADLAICMAIASAARGMQLSEEAVVFGEVGLSGEVRHAQEASRRIEEARKLGFTFAIGPRVKGSSFVKPVKNLREALNTYLQKS